jgi:quercetin dioxygenase-like cupin family protein
VQRSHDVSDQVSSRTPRALDGTALAFDLPQEARVLREEWPFRDHGHNARTLLKHQGFRVVLVVLEPGKRVPEHQTYNHVAVHVLAGKLRVSVAEQQDVELRAGGLLGLDRYVPHGIEALEQSELLICLGWLEP